jgi:two-component system response regulator HydG
MFGHIKGAFTDARDNRTGRIEAASGGTLFLDELGNLSMNLQSKLLRALEEKSITPVGSNIPVPVDLRLICATNQDLKSMITDNTFREDLYYRINTIEINIPPLRERISDIPDLVDYFLRKYEKKYSLSPFQVSGDAYAALQGYHWPGNVRELKHLVEKIIILNDSAVIKPEDLSLVDSGSLSPNKATTLNLAELEKAALIKALESSRGNLSRAARLLGISRTTLYSKLQKHGL